MDQPSRPAPVVSVHDPAGPVASPDLLDSGPEPARLLTRRRVAAALTVAAVLAGVLGLGALRERRALEAEEARLAAAVSLSVPDDGLSGGTGASYDGSGGELQAQLTVRNDGPRDVELVGARTSGFTLGQESVRLPTGQVRRLLLRQSFTCEQGRPAPLQAGPLEVDVRTGTGTTTTVELPLLQPPFAVDEAARMCGWLPVQEAVVVDVLEGRQSDGVLRLDVDLSNSSRLPVEVVRLLTGPGLTGRLLQEGSAAEVPLPMTLPAAEADWVSQRYEVELRVTDCAAARERVFVMTGVEVRDRDGATAEVATGPSPRLLSELLSASCP